MRTASALVMGVFRPTGAEGLAGACRGIVGVSRVSAVKAVAQLLNIKLFVLHRSLPSG